MCHNNFLYSSELRCLSYKNATTFYLNIWMHFSGTSVLLLLTILFCQLTLVIKQLWKLNKAGLITGVTDFFLCIHPSQYPACDIIRVSTQQNKTFNGFLFNKKIWEKFQMLICHQMDLFASFVFNNTIIKKAREISVQCAGIL